MTSVLGFSVYRPFTSYVKFALNYFLLLMLLLMTLKKFNIQLLVYRKTITLFISLLTCKYKTLVLVAFFFFRFLGFPT